MKAVCVLLASVLITTSVVCGDSNVGTVELKSWSHGDSDKSGFIKVNGKTVLTTKWGLPNSAKNATSLFRGIAIVVLDLNFNVVSSASFDTWGDSSVSEPLKNFVKAIPKKHLFAGVTADSAERYVRLAADELDHLGVSLIKRLGWRQALVFLGEKGFSVTQQEKVGNRQGPLYRKYIVRVPSVDITRENNSGDNFRLWLRSAAEDTDF